MDIKWPSAFVNMLPCLFLAQPSWILLLPDGHQVVQVLTERSGKINTMVMMVPINIRQIIFIYQTLINTRLCPSLFSLQNPECSHINSLEAAKLASDVAVTYFIVTFIYSVPCFQLHLQCIHTSVCIYSTNGFLKYLYSMFQLLVGVSTISHLLVSCHRNKFTFSPKNKTAVLQLCVNFK